jgi:hypothetical protein
MPLIITASEVSDALGISLDESDVQNAQDVLELCTGIDLNSATPEDRFETPDLRRLRLAVQWQTAYLIAHPEVLTDMPVRSASANGARLDYRDDAPDSLLSPLARRCLAQLSWASTTGPFKIRTLYAGLVVERAQPDPWVLVATGGGL